MNGHKSPDASSVVPAGKEIQNGASADTVVKPDSSAADAKGTNEDAESEAETLITSPVKKREAAKEVAMSKEDSVADVPAADTDGQDDADAPGSPVDMDDATVAVTTFRKAAKTAESSDGLSDVDDEDHSRSTSSSRASSRSREGSVGIKTAIDTINPRKRKHRASSVSLSNKRQSVESGRRRLRGLAQDEVDADNDRSDSPRSRTHRRAASTQSFMDGNDNGTSRKRRAGPQAASRESKQARWEESSVSSEATSHGHNDRQRPQRGVGRSMGIGRPVGREHKRHVNKYGFTRLAEACESGDVELAREWREKDPEQLELAEFAGNKPLQIAALNGNAEVVEYLIAEGCQVDCANVDKDTPLIDAAENGHIDVVRILLKAGVDPLRQNLKGQQALDVVADDTDNATEIRAALRNAIETWNSVDAQQKREEEEEQRFRVGPAKELHFMARTYENLLRLVQINDRNGVREFLDARVPVDNAIIAAAAKTGDLYLMNMLLAEMTDKKRSQKAEKPMLSVIGTSHFEMVKSLTELEQFNPLWTNRQGKKWSEIAEERAGPMWRQEIELLTRLEKEAEQKQADRRSSSPIMRRSEANAKHRRTSSRGDEHEEASDEDAADDDTPRRKNGRRLLSRKDLRKKSKADEEDSAVEDESDAKAASPPPKRGPGRPRTKSIVKHERKDDAPQRRRSSSAKQSTEKAPTVPVLPTNQDKEDVVEKTAAIKKEADDDAQKQKDAELAAEEARRQEEEAERQLASEQEAAAEVQRQQEAEARAKQLEEEEKERQRLHELAMMDAARSKAREELLSALPESISSLLDPDSDFAYDERGAADHVLARCEPLQVVYASDLVSNSSEAMPTEPLVLNLAVAPLLGKDLGLQLLLADDAITPAIQEVFLDQSILPGHKFDETERPFLAILLRSSNLLSAARQPDSFIANGAVSDWPGEVERAAELHRLHHDALDRLTSAPLTLRWLSLQQVLEKLHPALQNRDIAVRDEWRGVFRQGLHARKTANEDFFSAVCQHWEATSTPQTCRYAQKLSNDAVDHQRGKTSIHVTHEK